MSLVDRVGRRLDALGELAGIAWSFVYADYQAKLGRQSAFVGHIAHYVFLQVVTAFTLRLVGTASLPMKITLSLVYAGLAIYSLIYLLRLLEGMARPFQSLLLPNGLSPSNKNRARFWLSVVGIVVFVAVGNAIGFAMGNVLNEFSKLQEPAVELSMPEGADSIEISPTGIPKCYRNLCL